MKIAACIPLCLAMLARTAHAADPLPEGDVGIASNYDGDAGIEADPDVIFFDDFEDYAEAADLDANWESVHHYDRIQFATEGDDVFAGAQSLQFTIPQQDDELSNATNKWVSPELDALFLRYYSKFDAPYDVVGSSHNGSMISAHYFMGDQATPGVPADGTNKWLVDLENWRGDASTPSPGLTNVYVYHPEQRDDYGDHFFPTGLVSPNTSLPYDFGPDFVPRDDFIPELQRWYCWELMVQANTPGERDGRIAAWIDGVLVADWQNLRLRDVPELTIDRFGIGFHIGSNPNGEAHKWYDNVVAAHAYIGPMGQGGSSGESGSSEGGDGSGPSTTAAGEGGSTSESAGGDASASAGTSDTPGESTGSGGAPADVGEDGCGCRAGSGGPAWMILLSGLLLVRLRRPAR
jgi:hypothetical protein